MTRLMSRRAIVPLLCFSLFAVYVQVRAAVAPVITFTSPQFGQPFALGTTVQVSLTATVSPGTILRVVLVNNHGSPDTLRQSPYTISYSGLITGYYVVEAKVTTADTTVTARHPFVIKPKPYPALPASRAANGKVKIFILAGQSNMTGRGELHSVSPGSMDYYLKAQPQDYGHLVDTEGKPLVRNDVWDIDLSGFVADTHAVKDTNLIKKQWHTVGFSMTSTMIGSEYAFGWVIGDYFKDPVVLIKVSYGGTSLAKNWLPPSSGPYSVPDAPGDSGMLYHRMTWIVKEVTGKLKTYFPGYDGKGYEIMGFAWNQGENDLGTWDTYEKNMVNLINDLRKDVGVPDMPSVLAITGYFGYDISVMKAATQVQMNGLVNAQLAVGDYTKHPAFAKNAGVVETRGYQRGALISPNKSQDYHWFHNWESYYLVGEGLARSMIPLFPFNRNTPALVSAHKAYSLELNAGITESAIRFFLPEPGEYSLSVVNLSGKVVKTFHGNGVRGLNRLSGGLQDLPQGALFLRLSDGRQVVVQGISNLK